VLVERRRVPMSVEDRVVQVIYGSSQRSTPRTAATRSRSKMVSPSTPAQETTRWSRAARARCSTAARR
jgi:hypothetical protein